MGWGSKSKDSGSSARVDAALAAQRAAAERAARQVAVQQRQANPKCRADKTVKTKGGSG